MDKKINKTTLNQYKKLIKDYKNMFLVDMAFLIPISRAKLVTYRKANNYQFKTVIDSYRPQYYSFEQNVEVLQNIIYSFKIIDANFS